jgi:hypothetical protein
MDKIVLKKMSFLISFFSLSAILSLTSNIAFAQEDFTYQFGLQSQHSAQIANPSYSFLNQDNKILNLKGMNLGNSLEGKVELNLNDKLTIQAKPYMQLNTSKVFLKNPSSESEETKFETEFKDFYLSSQVTDSAKLQLGLMTYQWGPAELTSPSNALFHFSKQNKNNSYFEKGYILANIEYYFDGRTTLQALLEVADRDSETWISEVSYTPRQLLKFEQIFENSMNYIGFTVGSAERALPFLGAYAQWSPIEGHSVYFDARMNSEAVAYNPVEIAPGVFDFQFLSKTQSQSLALLGYRFEEDIDLRLEIIANSEGFTKKTWATAKQALASSQPLRLRNALRFLNSGREFLSQRYVYASARKDNIESLFDSTLALRALHSIDSPSTNISLGLQKPWDDNTDAYLDFTKSLGDKNNELVLANELELEIGIKITYL